MGCYENSHVHMYKFLCARVGPYRSASGDLNKLYRWFAIDLWAKEISRILLRFGFLVCILEDKVVLRFGELYKVR
jgi:hypothetical protein